MKRKNMALLGLFFAAGLATLLSSNIEAGRRRGGGGRRGGRGRVGVGVGVGFGGRRGGVTVGFGGRRGGFGFGFGVRPRRRSWWGRRWAGTGRYLGWRSGVRDDEGRKYWEISNNTDADITAMSDDSDVRIPAGSARSLYRRNNFELIIQSDSGETRRTTRRHFINIGQGRGGRLRFE